MKKEDRTSKGRSVPAAREDWKIVPNRRSQSWNWMRAATLQGWNARRALQLALLLLTLTQSALLLAEKPGVLYKKGHEAESRLDYETAFKYYEDAYQQKPSDVSYRAAATRTRVLAASQHVHRGRQMRDQGQLEAALAEFKKAAEIDPAGFAAQQEMRRTEVMMEAAKSPKAPGPNEPLHKQLDSIPATPVELRPLSADPITLNLTEDSKVIYGILGKLAGINVLVDPEYSSRKIHVELRGVTLGEALSLVAAQSKTYWLPMTTNTIFVTSDTTAKRKDWEPNVMKTFYLSNVSQASDLQDVVNVLRTMLEMAKLTAVPSQNAIIVRGTPDQVMLAGKFVEDLDKAKPEVIVEVAVMQVTRDRIKNLGFNLPTSTSLTMTGGATSGGTGSSTVSLNSLTSINANNFSVTLPSVTANYLMSNSDANLIQNPQIRALDGQKASLKIGERVPIAVGSFTAGSTATSALVNTQFQYIDVGVNIDITPTVHGSDEVTLKVSLDISAVDSEVSIGGISQPVIGQRKIEHTIRLKEGEVNLLGGLMEDSSTKSLSGYPGLMSIPILRYLFGNNNTDHRQTETVFMLIPHIVRIQDVSAYNQKQLDVGTASNIDLHMNKIGKPDPSAAAPAEKPAQPVPTGAQKTAPAPAKEGAPAATRAGVVFTLDPSQMVTSAGQNFKVDVSVTGAEDLQSIPLRIQYDPNLMKVVSAEDGGFLGRDGKSVQFAQQDDTKGLLQVSATRAPNAGGVSGQGTVFSITFSAKAEGRGTLSIVRAGLRDAKEQNVAASGTPAYITIGK